MAKKEDMAEKAARWDALQAKKQKSLDRAAARRKVLLRKIKEAGITVSMAEVDAELASGN